jgi:hypothetical protein
MTLIGSQSSSNGLYNTMIDAYQKAIKKVASEEATGIFEGDVFEQGSILRYFISAEKFTDDF